MPGFDGTGPAGMGPMTGGGRGYCMSYHWPHRWYGPAGAVRPGFWSRGRGRGFRHWFYATGLPRWARCWGWPPFGPGWHPFVSEEDWAEFLKEKAAHLEKALEEIKQEIVDLEGRREKKE